MLSNSKLYIKTYGCQVNDYDSARMEEILAPLGFITSDKPDDASMVILNTCYIREKAVDKVLSELGRLRFLKKNRLAAGHMMILAVTGCVAQADGERILERAPHVDIIVGPQAYHRLPEMVTQVIQKAERFLDVDFSTHPRFNYLPLPSSKGVTASLLVQEGCNKFCTFCVVPYTRGIEYSRPTSEILADAKNLVKTGVKAITLVGQNVSAYRRMRSGDNECWGLEQLLRALSKIDGLKRLRFVTSHPCDISADLITLFRDLPLLMPSLHLPIQSGSDRVLAAMNRGYTASDYCHLVDHLRKVCPTLALSGDFIVGFPGETESDFSDTIHLARTIGYAQAYSFKFDPRPGTPAAVADDQVSEPAKSERLANLQDLLSAQQASFNRSFIGQEVPVLLDRHGKQSDQLSGRSPHMQVVTVTAPEKFLGQIVDLRINKARANSLDGQLIDQISMPCIHSKSF